MAFRWELYIIISCNDGPLRGCGYVTLKGQFSLSFLLCFRFSLYISGYLCLSQFLFFSICLSLFISISVSLSFFLHLPFSVSLHLSVVCLSIQSLSLCISVSLSVCLCLEPATSHYYMYFLNDIFIDNSFICFILPLISLVYTCFVDFICLSIYCFYSLHRNNWYYVNNFPVLSYYSLITLLMILIIRYWKSLFTVFFIDKSYTLSFLISDFYVLYILSDYP